MASFPTLQRASFGGIEFPIKSLDITCDGRSHKHVYLKTPGALTEKMGRDLYRIEMGGCFDTNIRGYGVLWPDALRSLRELFEQQLTKDLVIPTIGTVRAWMPKWHQTWDPKVTSSENAQLSFEEDATQVSLARAANISGVASLASSAAKLTSLSNGLTPKPSIFEQIDDAVNGVLALKDQGELYGDLASAKIAGLTGLIETADQTLEELQSPANYPVLDALKDLWLASRDMVVNITGTAEARVFIVPREMTVSQISNQLYGNTSHAVEIMQNNSLDDPLAVQAGESIIYFLE